MGGRFRLLDIRAEHVSALEQPPRHHGDPFDRLLIGQARVEGLRLLGLDVVFAQYPVELLW